MKFLFTVSLALVIALPGCWAQAESRAASRWNAGTGYLAERSHQ